MAVTRVGQVINCTAAADAVTGMMNIQAVVLDHTAASAALVRDTAGNDVLALRATAAPFTQVVTFPLGLMVNGLVVNALSAGTIKFFLIQ